jgi:hypothetical protein
MPAEANGPSARGGKVRRRDIGRVWRVAEPLEYGVAGIDEGVILTEIALFGCMKENAKVRDWAKAVLERIPSWPPM